jgi:hypothetical protein
MPGFVLYRRDGTWIDVDPENAEMLMLLEEGEFSDSPAGPWKDPAPLVEAVGKKKRKADA